MDNLSGRDSLEEAGTFLGIVGLLLPISSPIFLIWRTIRGLLQECNRKCGIFEVSQKRDICLCDCRIQNYEKQIKLFERLKKICSKQKNPKRCVSSVDAKIFSFRKKIKEQNIKRNRIMKRRGIQHLQKEV